MTNIFSILFYAFMHFTRGYCYFIQTWSVRTHCTRGVLLESSRSQNLNNSLSFPMQCYIAQNSIKVWRPVLSMLSAKGIHNKKSYNSIAQFPFSASGNIKFLYFYFPATFWSMHQNIWRLLLPLQIVWTQNIDPDLDHSDDFFLKY